MRTKMIDRIRKNLERKGKLVFLDCKNRPVNGKNFYYITYLYEGEIEYKALHLSVKQLELMLEGR